MILCFDAGLAEAQVNVTSLSENQIKLWYHYEQIAMHFNELIIQYRLQIMGGAGALGAIGFFLAQADSITGPRRRYYRLMVSLFILIIVIGAFVLDVYYYSKLLAGAVEALLEFEKSNPPINMSTLIEKRLHGAAAIHVYIWYGSIILPLGLFTLWSLWRYYKLPKTGSE